MTIDIADPSTYEPARFVHRDDYLHFGDPESDCFACNSRRMLVQPTAVTPEFILMEATTRLEDGSFVIIPDCWLVFPREHIATFLDLPSNWTASLQDAILTLDISAPFNTGDNWGKAAGQRSEHAHTWIAGRGWGEEGLFCEDLGLATMILRARQYHVTLP